MTGPLATPPPKRAAGVGGDIGRFGLAILFATVFGAVQVFVIPRQLDVTTYGQYRLFLTYVGYIGLLHFGLADGAFLRWAGQSISAVRHDAAIVARWLFGIDTALFAIALIAAAIASDPQNRIFLIGFAVAALTMNSAILVGYALQAGGDFRGAGRVAVLAPGLFVAAMLLLPIHTLLPSLVAYLISFAIAAIVGAVALVRHAPDPAPTQLDRPNLRVMLSMGAPVLGANMAAILSQFGDRLLVSFAVPVETFAIYGFASSVMVTANAATQTLSRVALSHAARQSVEGDGRAVLVGGFYDLIATGFGVAMVGVPFFELLVRSKLPVYESAIPIVRALIIGAPFWVAIHVVLVGTLQSYGLVRRQMTIELLALLFVFALSGAALLAHAPLWAVAGGNSAAAVVGWAIGVFLVRRAVPGARLQPNGRFLPIVAVQSVAILLALMMIQGWVLQSIAYAAVAALPTIIAARAARRHGW